MRRTTAALALATAVLSVICDAPGADEVDKLVRIVKPPARFVEHAPKFTLKRIPYKLKLNGTIVDRARTVITDGALRVAEYVPQVGKNGISCGNLHMYEMAPTGGWNGPGKPKRSTRITTVPWLKCRIPDGYNSRTWKVTTDGKTVTIVDEQAWTKDYQCESRYVVTLACDPVLGYVVTEDIHYSSTRGRQIDRKGREGPLRIELCNMMPNHVTKHLTPRPVKWRYEYTLYTPANTDRYVAWVNDWLYSDIADGQVFRNGGISAFLYDPDGWSQGLTRLNTGGTKITWTNATCNLLMDQHNDIVLPDKPDRTGRYVAVVRLRMVNLPPEITRYLLARMERTDWRGNRAFPIEIGTSEGFEADVLPAKPLYQAGYKALPVSATEARSGKRSLVLDNGRRTDRRSSVRIDPMPPLEPEAEYELIAWAKVAHDTARAVLEARPAVAQRGNDFWARDAKAPPAVASRPAIARDGWKKLTVRFQNGVHGATHQLHLVLRGGGKAHFDDVTVKKVEGLR